MSRISRNKKTLSTANTIEEKPEENMAIDAEEEQLNFAENKTSDEHIARVVFEANATADQLARGHVVRLSGAKKIFETENDVDYTKGIITGIKTCSIYSDCSEAVTLAVNLFNTSEQQPKVQNEQGWLHAPQHTDFGSRATIGDNKGYKNLLNILPYEKSRVAVMAYKPEDVANDRYIQQYGSFNNENLWDGVVAFPGEKYYLVHQGHVVLSVIKNNWEQLGINVEDEHRFNGKYVQVPAHVFDRVIKDLEAQVLSRMPFTDLNDIRAQFTTKQATNYNAQHEEGVNGKYKIVVELGINYQFPPTSTKSLDEEEE